ncbi:hypothetical protein BDR06DRAFT_850746, partial [Suillus hirtellus]
ELSAKKSGYHFSVLHASVEQLEEFDIEELGGGMQQRAPFMWDMLDVLLSARRSSNTRRDPHKSLDDQGNDDEAQYWEELGELELEEVIDGLTPDVKQNRMIAHKNKLIMIKKVIILSILMQSSNQNLNALQSIFGIFLQSMHTPQRVIETLSRMGVSISVHAINAAIMSLSAESRHAIRALGQTLLAAYAYDNFDVDLKKTVHTVGESEDTLIHLTSGLLFPLQHGVTCEDLRCSSTLWANS